MFVVWEMEVGRWGIGFEFGGYCESERICCQLGWVENG
jgi:hypothetical protein